MIAARLVCALAMHLHANQASPLITWSIAGIKNILANTGSRVFNHRNASGATFAISDEEFLLMFNTRFPHRQATSWWLFQFSNKLSTPSFQSCNN
jgi:hypothetical protein